MKHLLLAGALLGLTGCGSRRSSPVVTDKPFAVVTQSIMLPDVPSGSAIRAADDGSFWIVSDDAPYLYRVSGDGRTLDSIRLQHLTTALHRIPKADKSDYESAVVSMFDDHPTLYAFGSGSHGLARDSMTTVFLDNGVSHGAYSLTAFYERVRQTAGIARKDFNIEGAALEGRRLVFFNRGTGHLIFTDLFDFDVEVIAATGKLAPVTTARVELPTSDSFPPGLSGGAFIDKERLLFCASAEATTDWYADGEVLGSYIGLLDIADPAKPHLLWFSALVGEDGRPVKDKLEGIDLVREKDGTIYEVVGVVDNDDGTSKLLHIRVRGL